MSSPSSTTSAQTNASIQHDFISHIRQTLGLTCSFQLIICTTTQKNEQVECIALVCGLNGNGAGVDGVPLELDGCSASVASDLSGTIHTSTRNKDNGNWIDEDDEPQLFTMTNLLSMGNVGSYFNDDKAAQQLTNSGFFSCTDLDESNLDEGTSEWLRSLLNLCTGWKIPCGNDNGESVLSSKK
eukprot:CAMPEP_0116041982 /NCGR_PEP_ID=MMETSP0321-20121206/25413_1 /TAXON_ID=163516 /ORGANISM="Leptocylindrus danicus var. danicus, Strain B650" /LENGTH=183 /DNA_ID=CAMNT_0003522361 /DNA_START=458 /DNA_END=1009 /DNA_ORIENTATION=+